jgi:hypothetical protein
MFVPAQGVRQTCRNQGSHHGKDMLGTKSVFSIGKWWRASLSTVHQYLKATSLTPA